MRNLLTMAAFALAAIALATGGARAEDAKTIKEVMKAAHSGNQNSLLTKVATGKGEKEDAEMLLALYKDLAANKPKKGKEEAWKKRTEAIVKAAESVVKGDRGAGAKLRQAAHCMMCHTMHK